MKTITINTTAYQEEDFTILTDLTHDEISTVLTPIIERERTEDIEYINEDLMNALLEAYPGRVIQELNNEYLQI